MIGGMPEAVIVSADFINEFDKEVNYLWRIYWPKHHEWFYGAKKKESESFMVIFEMFYYCILLDTLKHLVAPQDYPMTAG